jgi:hypothetical protein
LPAQAEAKEELALKRRNCIETTPKVFKDLFIT